MKKINYKGRCEKRKVSKCKDICRTYSKIQSALVNALEKDEDVFFYAMSVWKVFQIENLANRPITIVNTAMEKYYHELGMEYGIEYETVRNIGESVISK
ncbi:MAG: hypothetical protein IKS32_07320 [Solobacterium sp.]|nr:hypothetical protein [Solobacterium sp.]